MGDEQGIIDLARQKEANSHYSADPTFKLANSLGLWASWVPRREGHGRKKILHNSRNPSQKPECHEGSHQGGLWPFLNWPVLPADDVVKAPGKLHSDPRVQLWARLQQSQHVLGKSGAQNRAANRSRAVNRNHGRQDAFLSS